MTIIINVLGNGYIQSDTFVSVTAENVMYVYNHFISEHCIMPKEIIIINNAKVIKIDLKSALQSVIQSELEKQLQEKTI